MRLNLETVLVTAITVVIIYALFGLILSYSWNHSIRVIFPGTPEIGIWNALMLVFTLHILFGGFGSTVTTLKNVNN